VNFEDVKEGLYYKIKTIWETDDILYLSFKDKYLKHVICKRTENQEDTKIVIPWNEIIQIEEIKKGGENESR
jgi:hypothetical protein